MAKSSHLREINRRKVIEAMFRLRRATRGQIAEEAGLSQPTVGRIADALLAERFLREADPAAAQSAGRPSRLLELDQDRRRFLVIELGAEQTKLAAVPVGIDGPDCWQATFSTPGSVRAWADQLRSAAKRLKVDERETVVLSVPGVVDEPLGRSLLCPNVPFAKGADLLGVLQRLELAPAVVIQEIRALALGQLAAEPGLANFLLVDIGAGVGASAIVNGQLYRGPVAASGELGHIPVVGNRRLCGCGAVGCVETLLSRGGLLKSARDAAAVRDWPALLRRINTTGLEPWLQTSLDALASAVISGLNILGLREVILSGIPEELPAAASDYLVQTISQGAMWGRFGEVRCRVAPRRRIAGMVLAAVRHEEENDHGR